jgi:hypothetical protein
MESATSRYRNYHTILDIRTNRTSLEFDLFKRWRVKREKEEVGVVFFACREWAFKVILASSHYRPACCISKPASPLFQNFILSTKPKLQQWRPLWKSRSKAPHPNSWLQNQNTVPALSLSKQAKATRVKHVQTKRSVLRHLKDLTLTSPP